MKNRQEVLLATGEAGLVLPTILVFMIVLMIGAFYAAALSRTDLQVVTNIHNEKEALFLAEAGAREALKRLSYKTDPGIGTFDISFTGRNRPRDVDPNWKAYVVYDPSVTNPVFDGTSTVTTPSVQDSLEQQTVPYSTVAAGSDTLMIRWKTSGGDIVKLPGNRPYLEIVSTGTSGPAKRTVTVSARSFSSLPGFGTYGEGCPPDGGITVNGNVSITVDGGMQVNGPTSGECDVIEGSNNQTFTSTGSVTVGGNGTWDEDPSYNPDPVAGSNQPDPLAAQATPCLVDPPSACPAATTSNYTGYPPQRRGLGTEALPAPFVAAAGNLQPGIYYGGIRVTGPVTMQPGVYIIMGGLDCGGGHRCGFEVTGTGNVTGNGVMVYNSGTASGPLEFGEIYLHSNPTVNLTSPQNGDFQGIVLFQDRVNPLQVSLQAGITTTSTIDGVIYAINANLNVQGGLLLKSNIIVKSATLNGTTSLTAAPSTPPQLGFGTFGGISVNSAWKDF